MAYLIATVRLDKMAPLGEEALLLKFSRAYSGTTYLLEHIFLKTTGSTLFQRIYLKSEAPLACSKAAATEENLSQLRKIIQHIQDAFDNIQPMAEGPRKIWHEQKNKILAIINAPQNQWRIIQTQKDPTKQACFQVFFSFEESSTTLAFCQGQEGFYYISFIGTNADGDCSYYDLFSDLLHVDTGHPDLKTQFSNYWTQWNEKNDYINIYQKQNTSDPVIYDISYEEGFFTPELAAYVTISASIPSIVISALILSGLVAIVAATPIWLPWLLCAMLAISTIGFVAAFLYIGNKQYNQGSLWNSTTAGIKNLPVNLEGYQKPIKTIGLLIAFPILVGLAPALLALAICTLPIVAIATAIHYFWVEAKNEEDTEQEGQRFLPTP